MSSKRSITIRFLRHHDCRTDISLPSDHFRIGADFTTTRRLLVMTSATKFLAVTLYNMTVMAPCTAHLCVGFAKDGPVLKPAVHRELIVCVQSQTDIPFTSNVLHDITHVLCRHPSQNPHDKPPRAFCLHTGYRYGIFGKAPQQTAFRKRIHYGSAPADSQEFSGAVSFHP